MRRFRRNRLDEKAVIYLTKDLNISDAIKNELDNAELLISIYKLHSRQRNIV